VKARKPVALIAVLAALLCVPAAAIANWPATTRSHPQVGQLELQIKANLSGYTMDLLHVRLRSCRPEEDGVVTGCNWEFAGLRTHYERCATAVPHHLLEARDLRVYSAQVRNAMTLSVPRTQRIEAPVAGSTRLPICWYARFDDRPGAHLLAETHFGG
jgi:hypothetical protein